MDSDGASSVWQPETIGQMICCRPRLEMLNLSQNRLDNIQGLKMLGGLIALNLGTQAPGLVPSNSLLPSLARLVSIDDWSAINGRFRRGLPHFDAVITILYARH